MKLTSRFYEIKRVMSLQVLSENVESSLNQTTPLQISRDPSGDIATLR